MITSTQLDFFIMQNLEMTTKLKKLMADRLTTLMRVDPNLDTLEKVAAKSGVSYGSVRRVKVADEGDVSISSIERIAAAFGLTLAEFIGQPGSIELTPLEMSLLTSFRKLSDKDKAEVMFFASNKSAISQVRGLLDF